MRQLVYTMVISNNRASCHLWWEKNLSKHQKVSKYCESGCSICFIESLIFPWSGTFSTRKGFSLVREVSHKPRFFVNQGSFPQEKCFPQSRKFSTSKDFFLIKEFFHKQRFKIHTIPKIRKYFNPLTFYILNRPYLNFKSKPIIP